MSGPPKARLLTLDSLDNRTVAAKTVHEMIASVEADLGGELTTAKRSIIESGALLTAMLRDMGARWVAGEQVDLGLFATLSNAQRRSFETIGMERNSKDVTPSIDQIAQELQESKK